MEIYSTKVYTNKELESMVPFYDTTPKGDLNIQELEQFSFDRLKVLRKIDTMKTLGKTGESFDKEIIEYMNKYMPINNDGAIMKDDVSHHLLRLAFHKEPQRRWFINQERILFETRLKSSDPEKLMRKHNLSIEKVSEREMTQYKDQLAYLSSNPNDTFYKVDFRKAGQLMASHNTFLIGKMAYISKKSLIKIAIYEFEKHLEKQLEIVNKAQIYFENDEQISPMLKNFAQNYCMDIIDTRKGVKKTGKDIDISDIEELYEKSFPLCMKKLHLSLKKKHHLTHQGRMQYGLFLKGIGVNLENSINFWRSEFLKNPAIDSNLFDKKYLYGIKHHYGKAGKGTDYASYGCSKIINSVPGSRDDHGCPFRNSTPEQLIQDFKSVGIEMYQGSQITQLLKGNHYQLACKKYFDLTHPGHTQDLTVTHPSVFFFSSTEHLRQKEKSKDKGLLKK